MNNRFLMGLCIASAIIAAVGIAGCAGSLGAGDETIVYAMDNSATGNGVHVWRLEADGSLTAIGVYPTGGDGTGTTETPLAGPSDGVDPLGSQGSLSLSADQRYLLAVNAGDGTVSIFRVNGNGTLNLADTASTGGTSPVSVCSRGARVYVVNVNDPDNNEPATIARFTIGSDGSLASGGPTRQLSAPNARPSQISFAPGGGQILVTERGTNVISTFAINSDGSLGNPSTVASPRPDPFGFAFVYANRMVVAEAAALDPLGSSASSYFLTAGVPTAITAGLINSQVASCWVTASRDGRQALVSNSGSNTLTNYRVATDGSLTVQQQAVPTDGSGSAPTDSGFGRGYLVQLLGGKGTIATYSIASNGDITLTGIQATGLPNLGSQGIAVRD